MVATQVSHSSPLTASGVNLTVKLNGSRGIVDDSGLALDVGTLPNSPSPAYNDTYNIIISGSGAVQNKRVPLSWLESGISLNAARISGGILDNALLPTNISVSRVSASIGVSASFYATAGGTVIDADGNFQGNNASFNEITASSVISSSAEVSASSFHGDGSALTGIKSYMYLQNPWFSINNSAADSLFTANQFQGRKGGAALEIYFVAPASGSVRSVNVARGLNSATGSSPGASYGIQDSDIFTFFM